MTLQAINNIMSQLQISRSNTTPTATVEDNPPVVSSTRRATPVSYTTADGGLFVGYYLNIHV